ncbi:MAG TPA: hypothetical protein VNO24_25245 [Blastocatellia bacterium]|nr:hypothetical protein [Blastocatellia bacterium]
MTDLEVFGLLGIALALCISRWRVGILLCLLVGFLQDPLRKITIGEPIYFTALVGLPLAATLLGARLRNVRISFRPVHSWNNVLRTPLNLFILLVVIQSMAAIIKTGSTIIGAIGALSYLAPLPGILLGYQFSRSERDITRLIKVYVAVGILMVSGIYLSYAGFDWKILKSVGEGLFIYSMEKGRLNLYSGFLRSPEIAAWHAATSICLLILLALSLRRKMIFKAGAGVLVMFLLGALLLTGRRKFLVEIFMFVSVYALLLVWFLRTAFKSGVIFKSAVLVAAGLVVGSAAYLFVATDVSSTEIRPYFERGLGVQNEATSRATGNTIDSFQWVIERNGIFGSGAGTASQGAQHFGGGVNIVGDAAEGGLAKVLAELGIPGLVLLLWLVVGFGRYMWSIIMYITHSKDVDPTQSKLIFGLAAFLMTNGVVFIIAHQVFGDPFVLIVLGFFLGFVIAMPKMQLRKTDDRRLATDDRRRATSDLAEIEDRRGTTGDRRRTTRDGTLSPVFGGQAPVPGLRSTAVGRRSPAHKQ